MRGQHRPLHDLRACNFDVLKLEVVSLHFGNNFFLNLGTCCRQTDEKRDREIRDLAACVFAVAGHFSWATASLGPETKSPHALHLDLQMSHSVELRQ
mmetsp:Transcript_45971/g.116909  ORF Transcript_45971/g.116909 Transcript_45971/m.116909 type:complete len:97 (+) Transcript_45971:123-413(+)